VAEVLLDGVLRNTDAKADVLRAGCYYQIQRVDLSPGTTYAIDLTSKDFDAYLILLDANGRVLAEDDDSGGDLNARIVFTPSAKMTVTIMVTTYAQGATGKYRLQVRP
jgi:hypothetical protein